MKNWRTLVGALCIVFAMVLGAFAGVTYARDSGGVSASSSAGTRGDDTRLVSAQDVMQTPLTPGEAQKVASDSPESQVLASADGAQVTSPDGSAVAKHVTAQDEKAAMEKHAPITDHTVVTNDGSIRVTPVTGTRGSFPPGTIDAGGPYAGTEGDKVTFTVTTNNPTIIFFRYDFNNDGVFDFPSQAGAPTLGRWSTLMSVTWGFQHPYYGDVVIQGWDGVSVIVQFNTGDNLGQGTSPYWYVYPANSGWQFTPKATIQATQLGWYNWFNQASYGANVRIWDTTTQATVATCAPPDITYQWNWCTLSSPVTLIVGRNYRIAEHKNIDYYPYWMGFYGPPGTLPPYSPPVPDKITVGNFFYTWTTFNAYPATDGGGNVIMMTDFKWQETLILPDVASASGNLFIQNVAPTVFDLTTNPSPGLEGTPVQLTAKFTDAGLNASWMFRYKLFIPGQGTITTPWTQVTTTTGGAKVLFLHTYAGEGTSLASRVATKCGRFCITVDTLDWGPTGQNRIPALSELTPYDVVFVGTNYFHYNGDAMGNRLADYMDAGGNVILAQGALDNNFGCNAGICGRFDSQFYSPVPRGYIYGGAATMGTILVPGHPLLDGIVSVSSSNLHGVITTVNTGATRVVNWNNGRVLAAVRTNPQVPNGARSVALNFFPILGYTGGDYVQMIANAVRWASRQPDPTFKGFPMQLDPFTYTFPDDMPTTTPRDDYPASVEVKDDSDGTVAVTSSTQLYFQNFELASQCTGFYYTTNTFPPGWTSSPNPYGWSCNTNSYSVGRGPYILYYFNDPLYGTGAGTSNLVTPSFDLSPYVALQYEAYHNWAGDYPSGNSDGYIEASTDGGLTYPTVLHAFHHNNPGRFIGQVTAESLDLGGMSDVRIRYRYVSGDDWWWGFDNVRITGLQGFVWRGLGSADGVITIANVPPTVIGGFDTADRPEATSVSFTGFVLSDPALLQPTEWFAYAFDFDDASPVNWVYLGSLAPPKLSVLVVHTVCLGLIGATCADLNDLTSKLLAQDDVGSVATFDYINYPATPVAPTVSYMQQFDVIIVATNWAYFSYAPFDLARRQVGDNLATYIDSGRGGAMTMMCVYCLSGGNDLFSIRGRYMDDQYGPYLRANYLFPGSNGILELDPNDDLFVGMAHPVADVGSLFIHDSKLKVSVGGGGNAAGRTGVELGQWVDDSTSAVGRKVLANDACTVHFGGFAHTSGADSGMLFRNMVGCAGGGLPSPKIPDFSYTYADNGVYDVGITAIDDDMGFVWDVAANQPVQVLFGPGTGFTSERIVTISVDNVDPTLDRGSIRAFVATDFTLRVAGKPWNTVKMDVFSDGALAGSASVTRAKGRPDDQMKTVPFVPVDVLPRATAQIFDVVVTFTPKAGLKDGKTPVWVFVLPSRTPIADKKAPIQLKTTFDVKDPSTWTWSIRFLDLRTTLLFVDKLKLKEDIHHDVSTTHLKVKYDKCVDVMDAVKGHWHFEERAKNLVWIDFAARASDPGTDDIAFAWLWGDSPSVIKYSKGVRVIETDLVHVFGNDGTISAGTVGSSQYLGFTEPYFDRAANTGRSPMGRTGFTAQDSAVHSFEQGWHHGKNRELGRYYWVSLIVLDDDNSRGYPSHFAPTDGVDASFLQVDLTCRAPSQLVDSTR